MSAHIGTEIDHFFNETERFLSRAAAVPVLGTIAGLSKVLIGVAQVIVGLVGGILTLPARCLDNSALNDHFWTHAKHGAGNITAGIVEAIPLVGTYLDHVRMHNSGNSTYILNNNRTFVKTTHEDKFMPYESLRIRDLRMDGIQLH